MDEDEQFNTQITRTDKALNAALLQDLNNVLLTQQEMPMPIR